MTRLSVNINKIATLRNSRGGTFPSVVDAAVNSEKFGAEGITIHPRPDERHITRQDVFDLKPIVTSEFNIEGYPSREFIDLVCEVKPEQVTLVPDGPDAITSNQGWDTITNKDFLTDVVSEFKKSNIRVSIFIGTEIHFIEAAPLTGTDRIELYTEPYAVNYTKDPEAAVAPFREAALVAGKLGLGINAGHDLNSDNLKFFAQNTPGLLEVSIGHALIGEALYLGLEKTIVLYKEQLK